MGRSIVREAAGVACNARGLEAGVTPCGDRLYRWLYVSRICLSINQRYIHTYYK